MKFKSSTKLVIKVSWHKKMSKNEFSKIIAYIFILLIISDLSKVYEIIENYYPPIRCHCFCFFCKFAPEKNNRINMKYICAFVVLLIVGCSQSNEFDLVMNQANSVMEARQDDATMAMSILDGIKTQLNEMSLAQRMRFYLLYSKAMNKGYVKFSSDSIMKKVVDFYSYHGSNYEIMTAQYLLGCVYRDLGDSPSALKSLYDATNYAGEDKESYRMLAHIHCQIADLLEQQALVESDLKELDIARNYALLAGDTVDAITIFSLKAPAYSLRNQMDSTEIVTDSCINMFQRMGLYQYAAQMCGYDLEFLIRNRNFEKAKERISAYEMESGYFNEEEIEAGREVYYYFKGLYYLGINNVDSAQLLFRKCLDYIDDPNMKVASYYGLSQLYDRVGQPDSTAKYALLAYNANDSAHQKNETETTLRLQALYNYGKHQEEALKNAMQTASLQRWLFGTFIILAFLVCTSIFIYIRRKKAVQKKIQLMQERYETEKILLQREMEEMNALLEEKQSLLENKDNLLERKKKELNIEIGKREQSIAELQERIAEYERNMNIKDIAILEDEIQNAPMKDDFNYYLKNVTECPSNKDWDKLTRFAKSKFPKLYVMLRNYNISERELRICVLTRLMFKPKDVAVLVGCRFPEVSLTRSRLLKKIYGIDGKASDFDKRIMLMY